MREDVDFEAGYEEMLGEIIHRLANPYLEGVLDQKRANEIINGLQ